MILWAGLLAALPLWMEPGVPPAATGNDEAPPSAAKWIWNADEAPKDGGESYYRRTFALPGKVKAARARFKADDGGELYLNGRRVAVKDFARFLVPGTNTVAMHVRNAVGFGGTIFRADIECEDGSRPAIVSDRGFRAAARAPADFAAPGFDDSAWKPAVEQGDVSMKPWSGLADIARDFASEREYAAIELWRTNLPPIASMAAEPEPQVTVKYRGEHPFINVNGRDLPPYLNLAGVEHRFARSSVLKTAALGFPFFELQFNDRIERAAGTYDFAMVDKMAHQLLNLVPGAYIFLGFRTNFPKWCQAHRDECVGYGKGAVGSKTGDELSGRALRPSAASAAYRAELTRFHDALGAFVRSRPWAKRVVAIRANWGVYTEWHTYGFYECPDTGPAMTAAFRRHALGKYASAEVPTVEECERPYLLLDPVKDAKTLDFFRCVSDETLALQLAMARDLKRNFPGRLVGAYSGYAFTMFPPVGQNCRYDVLMTAPELDFCSNPASYTGYVRRPGGSYMQRAIPDAFRRHGKLLFLEDDMRFHHVKEWDLRHSPTDTPEESAAVMRRNFLLTLFDGCGIQLCDPFNGHGRRPHAFDDPSILNAMHSAITALSSTLYPLSSTNYPLSSTNYPLSSTNYPLSSTLYPLSSTLYHLPNDVLVLVDPMARFRWSANFRANAGVLRPLSAELPHNLHTCGVAVDIADVRDYLAGDYPQNIVCVADAFSLSSEEASALAKRLERAGTKAFRLEVPGAPTVPAGIDSVPLPKSAAEWRALLTAKGAHAWSEAGMFLRRRGNLVGLSVPKSGEYRITPPSGCTGAVELFSGSEHAGEEWVVKAAGPATFLFSF